MYLVSVERLGSRALQIRFSAALVSIYACAGLRSLNLLVCLSELEFGQGKDGNTPNTSSKGTSTSGAIASLMPMMLSLTICISDNCG